MFFGGGDHPVSGLCFLWQNAGSEQMEQKRFELCMLDFQLVGGDFVIKRACRIPTV